jgi:hypothetical protein
MLQFAHILGRIYLQEFYLGTYLEDSISNTTQRGENKLW